jgi:DNA-binding MarR family transcriptional regulator
MTADSEMHDDHPPVGAGSLELRTWIRLLACAKFGEKRLRRIFEEQFDTTLPRFDVMAALYRVPEGLNMSALSRALLVSNGNVTSIVRLLQEQGLLQSVTDPRDARSAIVSLTKVGRARFVVLAEAHHRWISESLGDFPPERMASLLDLLTELRALLSRGS